LALGIQQSLSNHQGEPWGLHSCWCDAVSWGDRWPTFLEGGGWYEFDFQTGKIGPPCCRKVLGIDHPVTQCYIPEEWRPYLTAVKA